MEKIKINLFSPVNGVRKLNIKEIGFSTLNYEFTIDVSSLAGLKEGQVVYYERAIYTGNGNYETIHDEGKIVSIKWAGNDDERVVEITRPSKKIFGIKSIKQTVDKRGILITLYGNHNIFQQDLELSNYDKINFYDSEEEKITSILPFDKAFIPLKFEDRAITSGDCVTLIDTIDVCNNGCDEVEVYEYVFAPDSVSRNSILIRDDDGDLYKELTNEERPVKYIDFDANPYFYHDENALITLFHDNWAENYKDDNCKRYVLNPNEFSLKIYDNYYKIDLGLSSDANEMGLGADDSFNSIYVDNVVDNLIPEMVDLERIKYAPMEIIESKSDITRYFVWNSPNGYEKCSDYSKIYTTHKDLIEGIISGNDLDFIYHFNNSGEFASGDTDVKFYRFGYEYGPHFKNGVMPTLYKVLKNNTDCKYYLSDEIYDLNSSIITGITFCLHFRKRAEIPDNLRSQVNTVYTSGNVYYDTWHIEEENNETIWWNGFDYSGVTFDKDAFKNFHGEFGETSDLLGYLNFTNDDVYYRKKKVSKTFLRLSFYTSKDPIEQKLLYYSTIFLDDGELYGKYIKQLQLVRKNGDLKRNSSLGTGRINENAFIVLYSGGTRVDTKITVTNEYDKTKCSEGFNLYLFAEDKNFEMENSKKTIYMKIEFNHAGNGKTIPMIKWPTDENDNFIPLTTDNFIDSLYIPITLSYINGRYVYDIEGAVTRDNNMTLVLYEPKLDMLKDDEIKNEKDKEGN